MALHVTHTKSLLKDKVFISLLLLVALILTVGTLFYNYYEHWGAVNSFYFSVTTLTTVGLGDFSPSSTTTKIFTAIYILFGLSIILGFVEVVAKHATRRYLRRTQEYMERSESYIKQGIDKIASKD